MVVTPFEVKEVSKDEFESVMRAIYSYIQMVTYILPMYTYILRMQVEKQQGIKRHLAIIGLSYKAQYLAQFVCYVLHITLVALSISATMIVGGLFPQSLSNSWLLMFSFVWFQGVANFGFIVLIVSLLPHDMYPKLAAKWGSLVFFGSSFVDFTIQKIGIAEWKKVALSLMFPTLSIARASQNIVIFEYTPGGTGLNFDETLYAPYHDYRVITYFAIMVYSLVVTFAVGLLFEKYGNLPSIFRQLLSSVGFPDAEKMA